MANLSTSPRGSQGLPPAYNMGVTEKFSPQLEQTVLFSIDHLRYTVVSGTLPLDAFPQSENIFLMGEVVRALPYYDSAVAVNVGVVYWHSEREQQRMLVLMNGKDCGEAARLGMLADILFYAAVSLEAHFTRVDFAVDVRDRGAAPDDILRAFEAGRARCASNHTERIEHKEGDSLGVTVAVGSRSSERYLRCYDKGKESGEGGDWVRVELECKGGMAGALVTAMLDQGIAKAGKAAILAFLGLDGVAWYAEALAEGNEGYAVPVERAETNHDAYLRKQVFPMLEKDLRRGHEGVRFALQDMLDRTAKLDVHGPFVAVERSRKAIKAVQVLERAGLRDYRAALKSGGADFCVALAEVAGFEWDKRRQEWFKTKGRG
jgi:hypothetical protein